MQIYLPIAEISVNIFLILGLGGGVGFLSGLFGVGGGFLITPLLIFYGIPPAVSVATAANQIVASSVSGVFAHWKRGNVDLKMGLVLLVGGIVGSTAGVWVFAWLRSLGQIDLVISLCYVIFLGIIGGMMLFEATRAIFRTRRRGGQIRRSKKHQHSFIHGLPFKMRFYRSGLYISALLPLAVGFFVGVLTALMGVGGGFVMVPAMIYLLGMPTGVVIGTSLFQIIFGHRQRDLPAIDTDPDSGCCPGHSVAYWRCHRGAVRGAIRLQTKGRAPSRPAWAFGSVGVFEAAV